MKEHKTPMVKEQNEATTKSITLNVKIMKCANDNDNNHCFFI